MATTEQIIIEYKADIDKLKRSNEELKKQYKSVEKQVKQMSNKTQSENDKTTAGFGRLIAKVAAAVVAFKGLFNITARNQQSGARLNAVLKATGGAAGITDKHMKRLTKSMQDYTGQTKAVVQDTQAILLTFKNIGAGEFDRAQKVVADISAVLGNDLRSAALQVGKALENPIIGMSALNESGISFSVAQKKVITDLVNSGKSIEAQGLLLTAIEKQVTGAAAALNATDTGKINKAINKVTDSIAKLGETFLPIIADIVGGVSEVIGIFTGLPSGVQSATIALGALGAVVVSLGKSFAFSLSPIGLFIASATAIIALVSIFNRTTKSIDELDKSVNTIAKQTNDFKNSLDGMNKTASKSIKALSGLQKGSKAYESQVSKLLKSLPKLADHGVTVSSSLEQIKDAQARLNKEMVADNIIKAEQNYNKLSDSIVDVKEGLGQALKTWQQDPTQANQAKFEKALITYRKMTEQIKTNGELAGKSQKDIADTIAQTGLTVKTAWADNFVSLDQITKNTVDSMEKYWLQLANTIQNSVIRGAVSDAVTQLARLQKLVKGVQTQAARPTQTRVATGGTDSSLANEKAIQQLRDQIILQEHLNSMRKLGGSEFEVQLLQINDKYKKLINDIEQSTTIGGKDLADNIAALRKKQELEILKLKTDNNKKLAKQETQLVADIEAKRKQAQQQQVDTILAGFSTIQNVANIFSDTTAKTEDKILSTTKAIAGQLGAAGQVAAGAIGLFQSLKQSMLNASKSIGQSFDEQLQKINSSLQDGIEAVKALQGIGGEFDIGSLTLDVKTKKETADEIFNALGISQRTSEEMAILQSSVSEILDGGREQLMNDIFDIGRDAGVGLGTVLSGDKIKEVFKDIIPPDAIDAFSEFFAGRDFLDIAENSVQFFATIKEGSTDAINALTGLQEAEALLLTATQKAELAELEHRKNIGEFEDNEQAYNEEKLRLINQQLTSLENFLDENGENAAITAEINALEEQRYATQQAITGELNDQLDALKRIDDATLQGLIAEKERLEAQIATGALREDAGTIAQIDALNRAISGRLGQLGFSDLQQQQQIASADFLREQLGAGLFTALSGTGQAVSFPSTSQPVVNVAQPVSQSTQQNIFNIDGVSFADPNDLLLHLNNQARNTTGRPIL